MSILPPECRCEKPRFTDEPCPIHGLIGRETYERLEAQNKDTVLQSKFNNGLCPSIIQERKQRWLDATETLRKQKQYIFDHYCCIEIIETGDKTEVNINLPDAMKYMIKHIDDEIQIAAIDIIGKGA
jgi:hypothetical protein